MNVHAERVFVCVFVCLIVYALCLKRLEWIKWVWELLHAMYYECNYNKSDNDSHSYMCNCLFIWLNWRSNFWFVQKAATAIKNEEEEEEETNKWTKKKKTRAIDYVFTIPATSPIQLNWLNQFAHICFYFIACNKLAELKKLIEIGIYLKSIVNFDNQHNRRIHLSGG